MPGKKRDDENLLPVLDTRQVFLMAGLEEADRHIQRKRWAQALPVLEALDNAYPNNVEVLTGLGEVLYELQDFDSYLEVCQQLSDLTPDDPNVAMSLASAYIMAVHPVHALDTLRRFTRRRTQHEQLDGVAKMQADLEAKVPDFLAPLGLFGEEGIEIGLLHEELQMLTEAGNFREAHKVAERLLRRKPDFAPALNNLSQVYGIEGRFDQAIATAERVLTTQPDNFHALSNLTRFFILLGRIDEARQTGEQLKAVQSEMPDLWLKQAEALSYLGDDEGVVAAFQGAQQAGLMKPPNENPFLYHLAAVAAARLGRDADARRHWQRALKLVPGYEEVEDNLADLRLPVGQRQGAWPFGLRQWLTSKAVQDLNTLIEPVSKTEDDPDAAREATQRYLRKHPEVAGIIPSLLDRGDPIGRMFALNIAMAAQTPDMLVALRDFAVSQRGPDGQRMQAAEAATQAGLLPAGLVTMWIEGEWHDLLLMGFELHDEPTVMHGPEVEELGGAAVEALHRKDSAEAERLLHQALEIEPDAPDLLNNLAIIYEQREQMDEAEALLHQIHEQHPDYAFATLGLARLALRRKDKETARALMDELSLRRRFNFGEFAMFCDTQIDLNIAEDHFESARSWLDMWENATPDHPMLAQRREQLLPLLDLVSMTARLAAPKRPAAKPKKAAKRRRR